jgi:aspartyl/asparaginyl beta-hydroxylase (cupin superfamily)
MAIKSDNTAAGDPTHLDQLADAAMARGDLSQAQTLLEQLVAINPGAQGWLKLASIRAAQGELQHALAAIHKSLALMPLDFTALLSKASLLERLGVAGSGEAFGRALAQKPKGTLAPAMARATAHAEQAYAAHVEAHDLNLANTLSGISAAATPEEERRIARFRTNTVRKTHVYHCEPSHFHFPGLVEREFHDRAAFPWLEEIEAATDVIAAELATAIAAEKAELVPYIRYADHEPLMQWATLNNNRDWTAIHLSQYGRTIEANAQHCPRTVEILSRLPQPRITGCSPNAVFSLLAPGTAIPPHSGVSNTRLLCHLPLIVPAGCWFRVGGETRKWERGRGFVFDDTIEHEAANTSSELRVVLIFDVWHPGLSNREREAVRQVMEADAEGAALAL